MVKKFLISLLIILICAGCGFLIFRPVEKRYLVEFKDEQTEEVIISQEVEEGQPLNEIPTAPEKVGYRFVDWQLDGITIDLNELIVNSDLTIIANYSDFFSCNFRVDGNGYQIGSARYGLTLAEIKPSENPSKVGYNFLGWSVNGELVDDSYIFYGDTNFEAVFEIIKLSVEFKSEEETVATVTTNYGNSLQNNIQEPTKEGYNFLGWTSDGETTITDLTTVVVTSNMVFTAVYEEITITIELYVTETERFTHSTYEYNQLVKFPSRVQKASHYGNNVYIVMSWVNMETGEEIAPGAAVNVVEKHNGKWRGKFCLTPTGTFVCQELVGNESIAASEITLNYDQETGILTSSQITEHLTLNKEFSHAMGIGETRYTIDGIEYFESLRCDYNYDQLILYVSDGATDNSYTYTRVSYPEEGFYL